MSDNSLRNVLTSSQRAADVQHTIDPGFLNYRRLQTILGQEVVSHLDNLIASQPPTAEWMMPMRIARAYTAVVLQLCRNHSTPSLAFALSSAIDSGFFCSTEQLEPCPDIWDATRVRIRCRSVALEDKRVFLEFSPRHIIADTTRGELEKGALISVFGRIEKRTENEFVCWPLLMGSPWLADPESVADFDIMWFGRDFYEQFVEDFDEFASVANEPLPVGVEDMQLVSERAFKASLARILGDTAPKDWGGETSDYFTPHLHLSGKRVSAAFLLKGPASFRPMRLNHLGKNNDQILRLAKEPAQVLFVQHCHEIGTDVRETLRTFAVQPHVQKRFCLIDGRDSLRLLRAYDLLEWAKEQTCIERANRRT